MFFVATELLMGIEPERRKRKQEVPLFRQVHQDAPYLAVVVVADVLISRQHGGATLDHATHKMRCDDALVVAAIIVRCLVGIVILV